MRTLSYPVRSDIIKDAMMEQLVKYSSDDEMSNQMPNSETAESSAGKPGDLESEWENFEKMLAGDTADVDSTPADVDSTPADVDSTPAAVSSVPLSHAVKPVEAKPADSEVGEAIASNPAVSNPYAYLSYYTDNQINGASSTHDDMEKHLEEFLEKTAQAASDQAATEPVQSIKTTIDDTDSDHSDSGSASQSGHSSHSRSGSSEKETDKKSADTDVDKNSKDSRAETLKRLEEMNPHRTGPASISRRRSGSRSRHSRSHRSRSRSRRSRSRRSRSRSRSRRHRHRSGSRSKHRRHRGRSSSRHRRRRRSRSPRHRGERDSGRSRRSKRRRSHRRSNSRERRKELRKAQYAAVLKQQAAAAPSRTEDFKAKMKRELQQAARDAMAGKGQATPQQALLQTMAAMHAKAQELTGVEVPKFYNPAAINPLKFAEQQQKRKLLWSKAAENKEQSLQKFQGTDVVADEKYRKLMGIKGEVEVGEMSEEQRKKQSELFNQLDQEYAFARITTHTHRGMGLGIVSSMAAQSANEQFNKP